MPRIKEPKKPRKHRSLVPETASINPALEEERYQLHRICFKYYRQDLCSIATLDATKARACIESFRKAGMKQPGGLNEVGWRTATVTNAGSYSRYFGRLDPQVKLLEHNLPGGSRLFYFLDEPDIHVVAIVASHPETDKNFR